MQPIDITDGENLQQAGLKSTMPRLKILTILENNDGKHLSAEDVYRLLLEQDESVALATIYRVLTQFEAAGLVIRHNFESERSVFELTSTTHHDHMVCTSCGKVVEFFNQHIEQQQLKVAAKYNFTINDHALTLYGICNKCSAGKYT